LYHISIQISEVGFLRSKYDGYHYSTHHLLFLTESDPRINSRKKNYMYLYLQYLFVSDLFYCKLLVTVAQGPPRRAIARRFGMGRHVGPCRRDPLYGATAIVTRGPLHQIQANLHLVKVYYRARAAANGHVGEVRRTGLRSDCGWALPQPIAASHAESASRPLSGFWLIEW
jgi:hypothetical protein